jgi:hypothetical protein
MVNARKSHGNAYSVFLSLEGWWILAGDNIPGNHPAALRPGGSPESTIGSTIGPTSPIGPIPPHPKSTLTHPKSIVDLGCELLIRVENGLRSASPRTCYRLKSALKIKESNQTQTVTGRKKLKQTSPGRLISRITGHTTGRDLPRRSIAKADGRDAVTNLCSVPSVTLWLFPLKLKILIHPYLPVQPVNASPTKSNLIKHFSEKKHMHRLQNPIHRTGPCRAVASRRRVAVTQPP